MNKQWNLNTNEVTGDKTAERNDKTVTITTNSGGKTVQAGKQSPD